MAQRQPPGRHQHSRHARLSQTSRQNAFYFGGPTEFAELLGQWRAEGEMKGLQTR